MVRWTVNLKRKVAVPLICLKSSFGDFSRSIGASIGDIEVDVDPCVPSEACWKVFGVNCYWFHHDKNSKT